MDPDQWRAHHVIDLSDQSCRGGTDDKSEVFNDSSQEAEAPRRSSIQYIHL